MPGIKQTGTRVAIAAGLLITLILTGCSSNNDDPNAHAGTVSTKSSTATPSPSRTSNTPSATSTPKPSATSKPTPGSTKAPTSAATAPPNDNDDQTDPAAEKAATAFITTFAKDFTNHNLSTDAWRAAVVPKLYDKDTQELYKKLDPYSIHFCAPISDVEVSAVTTFTSTYTIDFKGSTSTLVFQVMSYGNAKDANSYKVISMDSVMTDTGGC